VIGLQSDDLEQLGDAILKLLLGLGEAVNDQRR